MSNQVKFNTTRFGEIEVSSDNIINFPRGLVGFENYRNFVIDITLWRGIFGWMQSLDDPAIAFIITDPTLFCKNYEITLNDSDQQIIDYSEHAKLEAYVIVVVNKEEKIITANYFAPIVINRNSNKGKQIILEGSDYKIRYELPGSMVMKEEDKKIVSTDEKNQ
ncbi:MAG: flagellar assembly protein FliW [Candidatus Eremiobacterota bacterium]